MKIIIENGKIKVQSDYNRDFISRAKTIQGKWNAPYWVFPEENKEEVKALLLDVYGECGELSGEETVTVTVEINCDEYTDIGEAIMLGSFAAVKRWHRDREVSYAANVMLISGGFPESGGSVKNPRVYPDKGTIIRVKNIPIGIYEKIKDMAGVSLVSKPFDEEREALIKERETLMKRLSEINALLGDD